MAIVQSQIERMEGPFLTKIGEFMYVDDAYPVRRNQNYNIYYLKSKAVSYALDVNEREIRRKQEVQQEVYRRLMPGQVRDVYPKQVYKTSKNIKFNAKFINRVFAQNKLYNEAPIIEVANITKTNSYKFLRIKWQVGGTMDAAELYNTKKLRFAESKMPGISELIPPTQLHRDKILQYLEPQ